MDLPEHYTQEGNYIDISRKLHPFPPVEVREMGSQWDFGECRDALDHLFSQIAALWSWEGQCFSQGVTTPRPLPPGGASVSPHHMGKKSARGSIFGFFLLKYCYTKWNATTISV